MNYILKFSIVLIINSSNIASFFIHKRSYDFTGAEETILKNNLNDYDNNALCVILHVSKQLGNGPEPLLPLPNNNSDLSNYLYELGNGLIAYHYADNQLKAYRHFNTAKTIAVKLNNPILTNQANLEILKLLSYYNVFSNDVSFEPYLEDFKELKSQNIDHAIYEYYKFRFALKKNSYKSISTQLYIKANNKINSFDNDIILAKQDISNASYFFHSVKNPDSAFYYLDRAYNTIQTLEHEEAILTKVAILLNKGQYLTTINEPNEALINLNKINIDGEGYMHEISKSLQQNWKWGAFEKLKIKDSALVYKSKFLERAIRHNQSNNLYQVSDLETKYQTAEKEKQILIEQEQKTKNRNIAIGLGAGIIAVGAIGLLGYKNSRRRQHIAEQQRELEVQKTETLLKNQELASIDAMIEGQEKERQRLASDLHDSVGATLATARLQFDHLYKNKNTTEDLEDVYTKTDNLLKRAYHEIRNMSHLKNSGVLAKDSLIPALERLTQNASVSKGITFYLEHFALDKRLENTLEISIFRIIQELVTNIIKHSQAKEAHITLTQHEDSLNIMVEDDGKGFKINDVDLNSSLGLSSVAKRIEHLEGTLDIDSNLGKGTTIIIDIPLKL